MRLLQLPEEVLGYLREGKLTAGHARALITTENPAELARRVVAKGLSVRETERLAKTPRRRRPQPKSAGAREGCRHPGAGTGPFRQSRDEGARSTIAPGAADGQIDHRTTGRSTSSTSSAGF